ncbi:MAG: DnaT-like ssDNA-binding domain-containing protein [Aestuariibacter sp.]
MNNTELDCLKQPISNAARVLYTLGLRPECDHLTGFTKPLNYKTLQDLLASGGDNLNTGREINSLIEELLQAGLITSPIDMSQPLSGKQLLLPLARTHHQTHPDWHGQKTSMCNNWQPVSDIFSEICQLVGLIEKEYDQYALGEFIAYWMGRPEVQHTPYQWTQKFVLHLRHARTLYEADRKTTTGYQVTSKQAEVTLNENAKQLVEKYRGKSEK